MLAIESDDLGASSSSPLPCWRLVGDHRDVGDQAGRVALRRAFWLAGAVNEPQLVAVGCR
jgi:hypothetical protein